MTRILCLWIISAPPRRNPAAPAGPDLAALATWCERFSPLVGLEPAEPADSLLLDITGLEHLFGSERALAERIARGLVRRGLTFRLAVADTRGAAWAVAHYGRIADEQQPLLVPPGDSAAALGPLPVAALRLAPETVDLLRQLGIVRIEQLTALPRDGLTSRFGPALLPRLDQAFGRMPEPVPGYRPLPKFRVARTVDCPTADRAGLETLCGTLLRRLSRRLAAHGLGALRLVCRVTCRRATLPSDRALPAPAVACAVGLFAPSAAAGHLLGLLSLQLERLQLPGPVARIALSATAVAPLPLRQAALFGDTAPPRTQRQVAALVEQLSSRLGPATVTGVRLRPEAQPELAWRPAPLTGRRPRHGADPPAMPPPRPVVLLHQPTPVAAAGGLPAEFQFGGCGYRVVRSWGPERIETGWWRGRMVRRDYYRVETAAGGQYWLFRRRDDGRWFVHGIFD